MYKLSQPSIPCRTFRPYILIPADQEHAEGLSSRLQQRESELSEATTLIEDTRSELTALRNRAKKADEVYTGD